MTNQVKQAGIKSVAKYIFEPNLNSLKSFKLIFEYVKLLIRKINYFSSSGNVVQPLYMQQ